MSFNVPVPKFKECFSIDEVKTNIEDFESPVVVKAQVLAGGRGKGHFKDGFQGGVHIGPKDEIVEKASKMLGNVLITKQTGEKGRPCNVVMLSECVKTKREFQLAVLLDREAAEPVAVFSTEGGMNIEEVAEQQPDKIVRVKLGMDQSVKRPEVMLKLGWQGLEVETANQIADILGNLHRVLMGTDCTQVEINPLTEVEDGTVMACDAKLGFDDNAEFRQKDIFKMRDQSQEDARDVEAAKHELNQIGLDGSIGCLVNGAGLAMATMDICHLYGGKPANFLDVGGGANVEQMVAALSIVSGDPTVKSIFINIFGGILRCDELAKSVVTASDRIGLTKPLVIRLNGTNVDQAKDILNNSDLKFFFSDDLQTAAQKAVELGN